MPTVHVEAEPFPCDIESGQTALIIIDMQVRTESSNPTMDP